MNANEALKLSLEAKKNVNLKKVQAAIEAACKKGETQCFFYEKLSEDQVSMLQSDGFKVNTGVDRDGVLITISWNVLLPTPDQTA